MRAINTVLLIIAILLIVIFLYIGITSTIYQFMHPEKTQTQLCLHLPKTILLDFKE